MAKSKLNKDDLIEIIRLRMQDNATQADIASSFNVNQPAVSEFLARKTHTEFWDAYDEEPTARGTTTPPAELIERLPKGRKTIVITSAQCNTYRHDAGLQSVLRYVEHNDAELYIAPFYYGKTSNSDDIWFDPELRPFIKDTTVKLADDLVYCGHLNISPTAVKPTSGLHNYMGTDSLIIPHTKRQLDAQPTPQAMAAKHLYTTGTITQRNYIQKKAGQKAEWHHAFGAVVVEISEDGTWFVRQLGIESDTGNFYDFDKYYTPDGVTTGHAASSLVFGDIHAEKVTGAVRNACWNGQDSLLAYTKPNHVVLNDLHDHNSRNHHHAGDSYTGFKKWKSGGECVRSEVALSTKVFEEINATSRRTAKIHVVDSNHDRALERWLKETDYRKDHVNAVFYLELQTVNYKAMNRGETPHSFANACKIVDAYGSKDVNFLVPDGELTISGVGHDQHGDRGNNGARGSILAFDKQGIKQTVGHSHSAGILNGVYVTGACMTPEASGYASGGSSWSISHVLLYPNGKRTVITMKLDAKGNWVYKA